MTSRRVGELEVSDSWVGVDGTAGQVVPGRDLLEHTRTDGAGRYRPLTGARTLKRGWRVEATTVEAIEAAIETVYPLARTHQRQRAEGTLRVVGLDEVLARQSGRYEGSSALSERGRGLAVEVLCGLCVRQPVWAGRPCGAEGIPCPEPCSVMVSLCREAALWEAGPPGTAAADAAVAFAAFDEPGNELREQYLAKMSSGHG